MRTRNSLVVALWVATGCGGSDPSTPPDAAVSPDAPGAVDAGAADATPPGPDAVWADAPPPVDMDIRDLQDMTVPTGSAVRCAGVVVTARGDGAASTVLFVQEPGGAPEWSGVMVFIDTTPPPPFTLPAPGDLVTVEGTVLEFTRPMLPGSRTNIDMVTDITIEASGAVLPAPVVVPEADLVFGAPAAEQWEGVLVRVEGVTVATQDPFGEFTLTGGLKVDDRLFAYPQPLPGDTFTALVGPMDHDFGTSRILPRDALDLQGFAAGPPVLVDLSPPSVSVGEGMTVTYTVTLDRPAPVGGTTVTFASSDPTIALPVGTSVLVPETVTTATFDVDTLLFGGPVDITATLDAVTLTAQLTVLPGPDPLLVGVTPDPVNVLAGGGTALLVVQLDRIAPAGGSVVTLSSDDATSLAMPASVTVTAGETWAGFRVRAEATVATGPITLTATIPTGSVTSTVNIVTAPSVPAAGTLLLNEINYDVPAAGGDSNCDGVTSSAEQADEFVELVNFSDSPLDLTGVTIADSSSVRFTFPAFTLGSGEVVVVFGGLIGTMNGLFPWCTGLDGSHIGDARAFAGAALGLTNTGDTVTLALAATTLDTSTFGGGTDESETRSPDFTGAFSKHTLAPGHATDRNWTPGTLLTGAPFSAADPTPPPPPIDAGVPDAAPPAVFALVPATLDVHANDGSGAMRTGMLTVTLAAPAPTGGTIVSLSSDATSDVAVPATVIVAEGASSARFRVRADSPAAVSADITATAGLDTAIATVNVVTTATAPVVGDLVINEINYDIPTAAGDANCNGVTDSALDEFVELVNVSSHQIQKMNVSIWDATAFATPPARFTFASLVLGPGEPVVVFGGGLGTMTTSPWCTNVDGSHIGDAFALAGASMGLNNTGDTVHVTSGTSNTDPEIATAVTAPTGSDESYTRSPDLTGAFVKDTTAPGNATDRNWTPGTRLDAQPFSSANP